METVVSQTHTDGVSSSLGEPGAVETGYPPPEAAVDPDPSKEWVKRILPIPLAHKGPLVAGLISAFFALLLQIAIPRVTMEAIDHALIAKTRPLGYFVLLLLGLAIGRALAVFLFRLLLFRVAYLIEFDLRALVFQHIGRLSAAFFDRVQSGQLISRANSDIRVVQMFLVFAPFVTVSLTTFCVALGLMLSVHVSLTLVALSPLPLVYLAALRMRRLIFPVSWIVQERLAEVATIVEENTTGAVVVRSCAAERRQIGLLARAAERLRWALLRMNDAQATYGPLMDNLPRLATALVLLYGGYLTIRGETTVGALVAFSAYVIMLQMPFRLLGMLIMMSQRSAASAGRIFEILDAKPEISDRPGAAELVNPKGEIEFDRVSFAYGDGAEVLSELSFRIAPGERIALVGRTGSGKTSVGRLISRLYDASKGSVKIDGRDVRDLTLTSLRSHIGMVDDEAILFSASIRENIAYGRPDASFQEIRTAALSAGVDDFISGLPKGYNTAVGERGYTLSGGQRQRIAIARALLINPRILILDDATSSIDVKVERDIHETLRNLTRGRTTLIIAHRLSTIRLADRVLLLEDGRIAAQGAHQELLKTEPRYRAVLTRAGEAEAMGAIVDKKTPGIPAKEEIGAALGSLERAFKGIS